MSDNIRPKSCPFCGADSKVETVDPNLHWYQCMTPQCMTAGPTGRTPGEALTKWNYRKVVEVEILRRFTEKMREER
jgi:hypothetical protein